MPRATFAAFAARASPLRRRGHEARGADALAVQPEVLRARRHDDDLGQPLGHEPHAVRVLFEPFGKALVREVDERHEAAPLAQIRERLPLLLRKIGAARVVATAVNQHELAGIAARASPASPRSRRDAWRSRSTDRCRAEARDLQQRQMIRPRRIAEVDARVRLRARDQMAGDAQAAAAARRLHRRYAARLQRGMVRAVEELLDAAVEARVAGDRDVRFRILRVDDRLSRRVFTLASTGVRPCSS